MPNTKTKNPIPTNIIPIANFNGVEGSIFLLANASHMNANNGARVNIKNALRDWNIEAGTSHPIIVLSTPLSVNIFNDDPACSNKAQKIKENNINIPTTISLSLSSGVHFIKE